MSTTSPIPATPFLGAAYYPEHWTEDRWPVDVPLLKEAGIQVVRMMEFAWDRLEPHEGKFDFAWMDRAITLFEDAGIKVMLCTPTAAPPPWLTHQHPDILRVDDGTGQRVDAGWRRQACANVPAYQVASRRIVGAVAEHFGGHPNVIGWQIDNEFGWFNTVRCVCDHCRAAFQRWCEAKYSTLDALNAAWGTSFWSATYSAWEQIPLPTAPASARWQNPGLLLDYRRFSSDSWIDYQKAQIDLLRPHIGERPISHNLMLRFFDLDYVKLARDLDVVGYDNYPYGMSGPSECAFNLDLMRGLKNKNFWIVEQQTGMVNWMQYNPPVPPGQVKTWTYQNYVHGGEATFYFRERAVNWGQEQYHSGLLKHDGTPDRGWHEAKQVAAEWAAQPPLQRPKAPVAILWDYNDLWAIEIDPHNRAFSYYREALDIYRMLWEQNIAVDILPRSADISGYEVVFVPSPALIDAQDTARWRAYAEAGGKLVVLFRAFFKEQGSTWTDEPMPAGGLSDLLGMTVDEFISLPATPGVGVRQEWDHRERMDDWNVDAGGYVNDISAKAGIGFGGAHAENFGLPSRTRYRVWAETLKATTAEVLLRYGDGYYKDGVAATVNTVGSGEAYYLGCWCEPILPRVLWQRLGLQKYAIESDVRGAVVEIVSMVDEHGERVNIQINHTKHTVTVPEVAR